MLNGFGPVVLLVVALVIAIVTLVGSGSYSELTSLRESLVEQHDKNSELKEYNQLLRREVVGLKDSDYVIERAAREELGLARPDEIIFVFPQEEEENEFHSTQSGRTALSQTETRSLRESGRNQTDAGR